LRLRSAYLSRYTKVTKRTYPRKPAASNGLYTLLEVVLLNIKSFDSFEMFLIECL